MDDDELFRDLERVGARFDFGEYEARAYVTVLPPSSPKRQISHSPESTIPSAVSRTTDS